MTSSFFDLRNYVQLYAIKSFYTILYEIICNYKLLNGFYSFWCAIICIYVQLNFQ